jgi:aspartyl-tRNA(Asn)/glutamyl-tRNA(Gln) amidotransferase subunit A
LSSRLSLRMERSLSVLGLEIPRQARDDIMYKYKVICRSVIIRTLVVKKMIKDLHNKLKNQEITSVELTQKYLDAIKEKDGDIQAFLSTREEKALEHAQFIDDKIKKGEEIDVLAGIPYAAKDVLCVDGEITTAASKILEKFKAPYDATVIKRLKESGAVMVGKTNLDEFAMGASTENSAYQQTKNPHDLSRVPGGSSGGSAASVAAGEIPWALGSDTGGSIRQPASFCGVVGLKPTYGRVSRYGLMAMASSFDQIGPLATSVEDAAIVLSRISGEDRYDSTSAQSPAKNYEQYLTGDMSDMTIGVPKECVEVEGLDAGVREQYERAIKKIKGLGAKIETVSIPHMKYSLPAYYILIPSEVSSNMARFDGIKYGLSVDGNEDGHAVESSLLDVYLNSREQGFGAEVKRRIMLGTYALSAGYYDAYYKKAQKVRRLIKQDFEKAYEKVDCIFMPASPEVAFKFGEKMDDPLKMYLADVYTVPVNIVGTPGISLPIGSLEVEGKQLPVGGQFVGKWFDEENLLRAADAFETN